MKLTYAGQIILTIIASSIVASVSNFAVSHYFNRPPPHQCSKTCKIEQGDIVRHKLIPLRGVVVWLNGDKATVRWEDTRNGNSALWQDMSISEWEHESR